MTPQRGREVRQLVSESGGRLTVFRVCAAALLAVLACHSDPGPDQLKKLLVEHPEILAAAIEAHPAEVVESLNRAAATANAVARSASARRDSAQIEADFLSPKVPRLEKRAALGSPNAPITIVEYSDFQCPFCRRERRVLYDLLDKYRPYVRLVVKHTPSPNHLYAMPAAEMFEAIARRDAGAAFRYYDELFSHQDDLGEYGLRFIDSAAAHAGIDVKKAQIDARSVSVRATIAGDIAEGRAFGFTGTPGLLINGVALQGEQPLSTLEGIVKRHLVSVARFPSREGAKLTH